VKIEFDVTLDDIVYFNKYHFAYSDQTKKMVFQAQVIVVITILALMTVLAYVTRGWYVFISAGILFSVLYVFTAKRDMVRRVEKTARKMFSRSEDREMLGLRSIEIQDDGIHFKSQASEGKTYWNGLTKVEEDEKYAFIFTGSVKAHVIRKESVRAGQLDLFLDEIRKKLKDAPQ